jgi:hypothetical protein
VSAVKADRRTVALVILAIAVPVLVAGPNVVASWFNDGPGGAEIRATRPDDGWKFLYHAARLSRDAELGTSALALEFARERWQSPARAESVELVYQHGGAFRVPVPEGAVAPPPRRAVATPRSRLGWVVTGRVGRRGEPQMIALVDMHDGVTVWSLRRPGRATR